MPLFAEQVVVARRGGAAGGVVFLKTRPRGVRCEKA
jgi:hypothetical protein